ncbi:Protein HID [Salix suchowensis]|nr:Protein HID [Salix suchowensis]
MKERRSVSLDNIDPAAAAAVGRNGFVPTQEWVTSWQQGYVVYLEADLKDILTRLRLPMDCIMLLITELLPKVQDIQAARNNPTSVTAIIDFLGSVSLQDLRPWNDAPGIWNSTHVRLFYVKHTQVQQRQITEAVSNVVGGIWGRNSETTMGRARSGARRSFPCVFMHMLLFIIVSGFNALAQFHPYLSKNAAALHLVGRPKSFCSELDCANFFHSNHHIRSFKFTRMFNFVVLPIALASFVVAQSASNPALEVEAIKVHFRQAGIVPAGLPTFDPSAVLVADYAGWYSSILSENTLTILLKASEVLARAKH